MNWIHINIPRWDVIEKLRLNCPVCKKRRTFLILHQAWYGHTKTCLGCGDQWCDEGMLERPFMPKWREKSIARAKQIWKQFGPVNTLEESFQEMMK